MRQLKEQTRRGGEREESEESEKTLLEHIKNIVDISSRIFDC